MIKNIIFDLGNVLISFKPAEYFEKNKYPENFVGLFTPKNLPEIGVKIIRAE